MKILVLGASGLLGNTFLDFFKKKNVDKNLKVFFTFRKKIKNHFVFDVHNKFTYKDVKKLKPDVVINCIGAIKPAINEKSAISIISALEVNSNLPNNLLNIFPNSKIIHFNTDCVFSGKRSDYTEDDTHDFNDIYGMTKSLGEIKSNRIMNLRCSIIGVEKKSAKSLVSWFLNNKKKNFKVSQIMLGTVLPRLL
jgi:dTDP-4-dehydrorhamnose reductase